MAFRWSLVVTGAVVSAAFAGWRFAGRYMRFAVEGASMSPSYNAGDWLIVDTHAFDHRRPRSGEVVVARDPRDPRRNIIKRVRSVDLHGNVWLEGDNSEASTDSRHFGAVTDVEGLVRWRYKRG